MTVAQPGRILRETRHFGLSERKGRYRLAVKDANVEPRARHVTEKDVAYLMSLPAATFDHSAVMDFGIGVFQRNRP